MTQTGPMPQTAGTTRWAITFSDPTLAPLLVAECRNLSALLAEAQQRADAETTERTLAALLATLED